MENDSVSLVQLILLLLFLSILLMYGTIKQQGVYIEELRHLATFAFRNESLSTWIIK